jgi:hypothetical protein
MASELCGESRDIVAVALENHRAKLNAEPEAPIADLKLRLHEVMSTRAEKLVYVTADAEVPWGEFMELIDGVWPEVDVVSLLTHQVRAAAARTHCLSPSCGRCTALLSFRTSTPSK